ncbi:MAG TPA: hypothetical protein VGK10_11625 [Prolixibacteraceae bacterium]|jgi:hypothetical protein
MKLNRLLLLTAALLATFQLTAQDLIYRKNGQIIRANIVHTTNNSISYKIYDQTNGKTYFVTHELIDSIAYQNGKKEIFQDKALATLPVKEPSFKKYNHHLIGMDLASYLFYRNLALSYELLPTKHLGFKIVFSKNFEQHNYYPNQRADFNLISNWTIKAGVNYYIFAPGTFRFGTGLHYIFGTNTNKNQVSIEGYPYYRVVKENNQIQGVILSLFALYNIDKNLAINLGPDIFINSMPASFPAIRCELLLNF